MKKCWVCLKRGKKMTDQKVRSKHCRNQNKGKGCIHLIHR